MYICGRAKVGVRLIGVEVLGGRITERHLDRLAPLDKIGRRAAADGAVSFIIAFRPRTKIANVTSLRFGPESQVLRIENAFRNQGFFSDFFPVQSVWGLKADESRFF